MFDGKAVTVVPPPVVVKLAGAPVGDVALLFAESVEVTR
jgi:hypothetical protein